MRKLYALEEDLRAALPVVERLLLLGQRLDVGGAEALLEEPVRGMRGEGEDAAQPQPARPLLALARLTTVGLLPPPIREAYGFEWSPRKERTLRLLSAATR